LAVHTHCTANATVVHVARLSSGKPVSGAKVSVVGTNSLTVSTDKHGIAVLKGEDGTGADTLIRVAAGKDKLLLPLGRSELTADGLFPDLAAGSAPAHANRRAMLITDRGIYRPGATVHTKATLFRYEQGQLKPMAGQSLRLRLLDPTGDAAVARLLVTSAQGSGALNLKVPAEAKLGRYQAVLEDPLRSEPLASTFIRVAAFEPPRFKVDVYPADSAGEASLRATVQGKYLFGAAMDGASVEWSVRRSRASFPAGPLTTGGLVFRPTNRWFEEDTPDRWSRTGEGVLSKDGTLVLEQAVQLDPRQGPQRFTIEADVTDSSYRHVAGRTTVVKHPVARYAGLRAPRGWVDVGQDISAELGVINTQGKPVVGADVTARLHRVRWRYLRHRISGGALRWQWRPSRTEVAKCTVKSGLRAKACKLKVSRSGDYDVTAEVDGRAGGRVSFWAWKVGDRTATVSPSKGSVLQVLTDKTRYAPGETAQLLVRNPYPAATAVLTTQMGGLLDYRSATIRGPAGKLTLPITQGHAPYVNATVTLLPIGAKGEQLASFRVGAVRLPVSLSAARLGVHVASGRTSYRPGQYASVSVRVSDGGKPAANAEVALAIVDEGVLRLTAFHAADPVKVLRPGFPLSFHLRDSRQGLAELFERSHVSGGGGMEEEAATPSRRKFVKTALWRPQLKTDENGLANVKFKLPDNLTEFRITAVAVDEKGKGGAAESSFTVRKPVMLAPLLPRFATVGDRFEVAAMLHNNGKSGFEGVVRLGQHAKSVNVPAAGRKRVGFPLTADKAGELKLTMAVSDRLGEQDRVEKRVPVLPAGIEVRPRLAGAFVAEKKIAMRIPRDIVAREDEAVVIQVGQHLWPELGARMKYLLDYPHGCVEQTTSSTLPLIAARDILPRIGLTRISAKYLNVRIRAGLQRLAKMRTPSGGLAYWPGGDTPNVYGTAYAIRAVIRAKRVGVKPPAGLLAGMRDYLKGHLLDANIEPEVKTAIAQSLAELKALPPSSGDALYDLKGKLSVFGQAALAIALGSLKEQGDRVEHLLDQVEQAFDKTGKLQRQAERSDFSYFGSNQRTRAQAAIALSRLRRRSELVPLLVNDLASRTHGYTTQGTAYSLLAVADHLKRKTAEGAGVEVALDGRQLRPSRNLGVGSLQFRIPLAKLAGVKPTLTLTSSSEEAIGYMVSSTYRLPLKPAPSVSGVTEAKGKPADYSSLVATSAQAGPDVYRVYSSPRGAPLDLNQLKAGDVVRVALLVRLPSGLARDRRGYVAISDRLPAGFEPIQPDLATVAAVHDMGDEHPFAERIRYNEDEASHVELHDDRVNVYFDSVWQDEVVASYLVRATTPGQFVLPPAVAELMYEPDSLGYSEAGKVVIQ